MNLRELIDKIFEQDDSMNNLLNIINESFDKKNKNILAESKGKKVSESIFENNFDDHSDELDMFYNYIFDAAEDLGFQDFDVVDDGWAVTLTYTDSVGNKQQAEFDFDYIDFIRDVNFESKEDAVDFLKSLNWKVVDSSKVEENVFIKKPRQIKNTKTRSKETIKEYFSY